MPCPLERLADRGDAAVHHVRRRDDVGTGFGLDQSLVGEDLHRVVVDDVAGHVDQAIMAVRGVRIERDVGQHSDLGNRVLDRLDRAANEIVCVERLARVIGAQVLGRVGEQSDARDAERGGDALACAGKPVDAPPADTREARRSALRNPAFADEERPDEVARMKPVLGEHGAHPRLERPRRMRRAGKERTWRPGSRKAGMREPVAG